MMEVKVKFLARGLTRGSSAAQYRRMLPDSSATWGSCRFCFDIDETDYDWLVVYHDIPDQEGWLNEQRRYCPEENTILVTLEPSAVTVYGTDYVKQFGRVITFQEPWALQHPRVNYRAPGLMWYYGYSFDHGTCSSYDEIVAEEPHKTNLISMMCSSRTGRVTLHSKRREFSRHLQQDLPELDIYGHGLRRIDDKAQALRPYMYHIVVENHVAPHHLTEKLPDAFLGYSLPFYHGAPNAADYFPSESFITIDMNDYGRSLEKIRSHIANDEYRDRLPYIREARRRVLEEMNLFSILDDEISNHSGSGSCSVETGVIRNRRTMRLKNPVVAVRSLSEKVYVKARHRLTSFFR